MLLGFAFQCLFALQLLCFHRGASQTSDPDAPRIRVNGGFADVVVNDGSEVLLQCEDNTASVDANYFLNGRTVLLPSRETNGRNTRVIASMSVRFQGRYICQTKQSQEYSTNEIAIISKWIVTYARS